MTETAASVETSLSIEIEVSCAAWEDALADAETAAGVAARRSLVRGLPKGAIAPGRRVELGILLADDTQQRRLNREWRGVDRPTNVLAFPGWDLGVRLPIDAPVLLGDVVLAYETVGREAREQGKPFADHLRHLVVHGVLHLLGYDHVTDADAIVMEALEILILAELGVADPYRTTM